MAFFFIADLAAAVHKGKKEVVLSEQSLRDKVKGAWAGQTLGCSYGGPTEFKFLGTIIQDYIPIPWDKHTVKNWYDTFPGLYDDVYVDLTFWKSSKDAGWMLRLILLRRLSDGQNIRCGMPTR